MHDARLRKVQGQRLLDLQEQLKEKCTELKKMKATAIKEAAWNATWQRGGDEKNEAMQSTLQNLREEPTESQATVKSLNREALTTKNRRRNRRRSCWGGAGSPPSSINMS